MNEEERAVGGWWARSNYRPFLLLLVCGALVYGNALSGPFIYDDETFIEFNEDIRQLWPPEWGWPSGGRSLPLHSRPLTSFTLAIKYAFGGLQVEGYHLFNIAVHILCGLAFYGVVSQATDRYGYGRGPAMMCASLWLLHPLHTESVDYVSQRSGLLMGLFYTLSFYCAQRGMAGTQKWYGLAIVCCMCSVSCKEAAATVPLIVLLYDRTCVTSSLTMALRRRWALYGGLALVWPLVAYLLWLRPHGGAIGFDLGVSPWDYALNQCAVVGDYLLKVLWPTVLNFDYGQVQNLALGDVWPEALLLVALLAASLWALYRRMALGVAAAFFFIALAPTSSFVPIVTAVGAERRMYLPLMGAVVVVVFAVRYVLGRWAGQRAGLCGAVVGCLAAMSLGGLTIARNAEYRDPVVLWASAIKILPDNLRAWAQLGDALVDAGRFTEAVTAYDSALRIFPSQLLIHVSKARALGAAGQGAEEVAVYQHILEQSPGWAEVRNSLGIALEKMGDSQGAIAEYRRAIELRPDFVDARFNLGLVLEAMDDFEGAMAEYRIVIATKPEWDEGHKRLARMLQEKGALAEAVLHYERAAQLAPGDVSLYNTLGAVLGTLQRYEEAVVWFQRALDLDPNYDKARANLAQIRRLQ